MGKLFSLGLPIDWNQYCLRVYVRLMLLGCLTVLGLPLEGVAQGKLDLIFLSPKSAWSETTRSKVLFKGQATNITRLKIGDDWVSLDKEGKFYKTVTLPEEPGRFQVKVLGVGRSKQTLLKLFHIDRLLSLKEQEFLMYAQEQIFNQVELMGWKPVPLLPLFREYLTTQTVSFILSSNLRRGIEEEEVQLQISKMIQYLKVFRLGTSAIFAMPWSNNYIPIQGVVPFLAQTFYDSHYDGFTDFSVLIYNQPMSVLEVFFAKVKKRGVVPVLWTLDAGPISKRFGGPSVKKLKGFQQQRLVIIQ